jgi:hypothetical protein
MPSNHYPENLSLCIMQDMPWVVKAFVNLMWPFVDAATKKKVKFASADGHEVVQDGEVEKGLFLKDCGGDLDVSGKGIVLKKVALALELGSGKEEGSRGVETV